MASGRDSANDDEVYALHRALSVAARRWRVQVQRRLRSAGLGELDAQALAELQREAPLKQRELADRLGVSNTSAMQVVDKLESAGLVERREADGDRRSNFIVPLASAATALTVAQAALRAVGGEALAEVSAADLAATLRVLDTILGRLDG